MEVLVLIGSVIGILGGAISIAEKTWGVIPGRNAGRRPFRKHYGEWRQNDHASTPSSTEVRRFAGYATRAKLNQDELAFALQAALYAGDPWLRRILERNKGNPIAIERLLPQLGGAWIRVGWRTEYALMQLGADQVIKALLADPSTTPATRAAGRRVLERSVVPYLRNVAAGEDQKLRGYAVEVLQHLGETVQEDVPAKEK